MIRSAHDCAEGGFAVALAECCFDSGLGVMVDVAAVDSPIPGFGDIATLFGESASRVVVSAAADRAADLLALAAAARVPAAQVGAVGGDRIQLSVAGRPVLDEPLADAERIWSSAIETYFQRPRAIA
jgi:phosphoribosylformylglycinamidine synthase subunit PurL